MVSATACSDSAAGSDGDATGVGVGDGMSASAGFGVGGGVNGVLVARLLLDTSANDGNTGGDIGADDDDDDDNTGDGDLSKRTMSTNKYIIGHSPYLSRGRRVLTTAAATTGAAGRSNGDNSTALEHSLDSSMLASETTLFLSAFFLFASTNAASFANFTARALLLLLGF